MITYSALTSELKENIARHFREVVVRHLCPEEEGGFTFVAVDGDRAVGVISSFTQQLPNPLTCTKEAYIDVIEVLPEYRRYGIGQKLVRLTVDEARQRGAYQLRAWSSGDKTEAIPMWKHLGFALCPASTYPRGQEIKGYYVSLTL